MLLQACKMLPMQEHQVLLSYQSCSFTHPEHFCPFFCEQVKTKQNATEIQQSIKLLLANICVTYSPTIPNLDFVSLKMRADLSVAEKLKETMFASL